MRVSAWLQLSSALAVVAVLAATLLLQFAVCGYLATHALWAAIFAWF